ncbi:alpha/beta fold hydrolase [Haliea sp. E17]|uniref:alpha/beta fold hydrolase n=1 Tax=Haliea sp. E17 TaxID=3401576 RepID=UPI003AAAA5D3
MHTEQFSVVVDGITLWGETRGDRPDAVFLHGMGGDRHSWDRLWEELADIPAVRYDLRGFGRSGWDPEQPYDHARDLLAVLDSRGIDAADLVGVSLGGAVALNFALAHPQRVRSLVLVSPGIVAWEWSGEWRERWRAVADAMRGGRLDEARERWWQHPLFEPARHSAAADELRQSILAYSGVHWQSDPHVRALPDMERLHQLQAPTLLLTGLRDLPDFRLIGDVIEASVPRLRRVDFADHGHLLQIEAPRACAREIREFWKMAPDYWV